MPPGKRRQSNAMLYTLITFIGLFIVATTVAVIYYVRAEELRTSMDDLQEQTDRVATPEEARQLGAIVGQRLPGESGLGTMAQYLDQMVSLIKGAPVQPTTAEVKVGNALQAVGPLLVRASDYIALPTSEPNQADPNAAGPMVDPNQVALTSVVADVLTELQRMIDQSSAVQKQLAVLQSQFDDATVTWEETKQDLTAKVGQYEQQVQDIKSEYDKLKVFVQQDSDQRVANLLNQLDQESAKTQQLNQDLLKTQAELSVAQERLEDAMRKVSKIQPPPDANAPALTPDGQVVLVDDSAGVIHIDLGGEDQVYRGLTFSVYDRSSGIPNSGTPKAEVEIFIVENRTSVARVLSQEKRNPIATGDVVGNLIWDKGKVNRFVVAGEFDLDANGQSEYDAVERIGALIQKWGGTVSAEVSAKTDFVILGEAPAVPREPTLDDLAVDPTAMERFEAARERLQRYEQIRQRTQNFSIPMFNYDRFLHFTGYASNVGKPGAF